MILNRDTWNHDDILKFYEYEDTLIGSREEIEFEIKVVNTRLKCIGRTTSKAKMLVKEIKKGNYMEFLNNLEIRSFMDTIIYTTLVCEIKDFDLFRYYLDKIVVLIDNWATADNIKPIKQDKSKLYSLALEYLKSDLPFVRRTGVDIFFKLIDKYNMEAYDMLDSLSDEKEYYVNMCAAWLLCELMIKDRDNCVNYYKNSRTNDFIINKSISKCRDSFRVSKEDKEYLLKYKRK